VFIGGFVGVEKWNDEWKGAGRHGEGRQVLIGIERKYLFEI